ncbi:hypothetical protein [Desulfovibrio sp. JC022]|uniref:hypothetical protein n=1 Tax=Desulfovibrio sp. JC022 TaxID=2593642 RepID=UPI0013D5E821|nr:hypothetical protein [Desulfovibrio sp. JC022]NDV21749.1 hypothetical protein [Desulfovibrio sp. JC022]
MKQVIKLFFLVFVAALLLPPVSSAQNMADGLQCPSDWHRSKRMPQRWDVNDLLKQCTPQTNDALIQLYAERASSSLVATLDKWTQRLRRQGLPYQRLLNEQPGHVSGYPAILRFFSGYDRDGKWYDSYLVASSYRGTTYIFIGYAMKGHDRVRIQMRNAMNAWHYPGVSGPTNSGYSSNNNQQSLPNQGPVISQNTNPNANVNINPTINVNRPGCTRQTSSSSTNTNTINDSGNSFSNSQDTEYSNSGNTYQNRQDTKPDSNNNPDNSNNNDNNQKPDRPTDNKYLDYMLK